MKACRRPMTQQGCRRLVDSKVVLPGTPLRSEELGSLARIGERSPCTRRSLEYFLPAQRYYIAFGTLAEDVRSPKIDSAARIVRRRRGPSREAAIVRPASC